MRPGADQRGTWLSDERAGAAEILSPHRIDGFRFVWPDGPEDFEGGWSYQLKVSGETHTVRHGLGGRVVYGRKRVHSVTWLGGEVQVEGVEADNYPATQALVSLLRHPGKQLIRTRAEVPADYDGFDVVDHRREIEAKWSRRSLAVKIREDNLLCWGVHAQPIPAPESASIAGSAARAHPGAASSGAIAGEAGR
jgi:hypothetical protein